MYLNNDIFVWVYMYVLFILLVCIVLWMKFDLLLLIFLFINYIYNNYLIYLFCIIIREGNFYYVF